MDIPYQRAERARQYVSISKHMKSARNNYSKWVCIPIERQTFDAADYGNHQQLSGELPWVDSKGNKWGPEWMDAEGNLWGFLSGFADVGVDGEQFGFFPAPTNQTDPWHGYPIIPFQKRKISQELLSLWVEKNYINEDDIPSIVLGRKV